MTTPGITDPALAQQQVQPGAQPPAPDPALSAAALEGGQPPAAGAAPQREATPQATPGGETLEQRAQRLEAENQQYRQAQEQYREAREFQEVENDSRVWATRGEGAALARQLVEAQGLTPEAAQMVVEAQRQLGLANARLHYSEADRLARMTGAPREVLVTLPDTRAMRAYADQWGKTQGPQSRELNEVKQQLVRVNQELAALKRGQVPAQTFNAPAGGGGGAGNPSAVWAAYGRGELPFNAQVREAGKALGAI
jgi:hypothetical protein